MTINMQYVPIFDLEVHRGDLSYIQCNRMEGKLRLKLLVWDTYSISSIEVSDSDSYALHTSCIGSALVHIRTIGDSKFWCDPLRPSPPPHCPMLIVVSPGILLFVAYTSSRKINTTDAEHLSPNFPISLEDHDSFSPAWTLLRGQRQNAG